MNSLPIGRASTEKQQLPANQNSKVASANTQTENQFLNTFRESLDRAESQQTAHQVTVDESAEAISEPGETELQTSEDEGLGSESGLVPIDELSTQLLAPTGAVMATLGLPSANPAASPVPDASDEKNATRKNGGTSVETKFRSSPSVIANSDLTTGPNEAGNSLISSSNLPDLGAADGKSMEMAVQSVALWVKQTISDVEKKDARTTELADAMSAFLACGGPENSDQPADLPETAPTGPQAPIEIELPEQPLPSLVAGARIVVGEGTEQLTLRLVVRGNQVDVAAISQQATHLEDLKGNTQFLNDQLRQHGLALGDLQTGLSQRHSSPQKHEPRPSSISIARSKPNVEQSNSNPPRHSVAVL